MAIDTTSPRSRRAILMGAMGAVAASIASTVGRASPVRAADGNTVHVGGTYSATTATTIHASGDDAFSGYSDSGQGVAGYSSSGVGIGGESSAADQSGVRGISLSGGTGVQGWCGGGNPVARAKTGVAGFSGYKSGVGVYGETSDTINETYGVHGRTQSPLGRAVFGWAVGETSGGTGVWGQADSGTGVGVRGYAWDGYGASGNYGTGLLGSSGSHAFPPPEPLANTGVYGIGTNGRGGVFKGDRAQVRLVPSSAASHPSSGALGDLFLDSSGRLWFCKGGTTWKQIA